VESCKLRYFNSFEFFDHTGTRDSKALGTRTGNRCLAMAQRLGAVRIFKAVNVCHDPFPRDARRANADDRPATLETRSQGKG
jgi:hypothetical protein